MRLFLAAPYVAVLAADVIAIVVARHIWPPASFYTANLGLPFVSAAVFQIASTLPLLYEFVDAQAVFRATGMYWIFAVVATIALLVTGAGWMLTKRPSDGDSDRNVAGMLVSLATAAALFAPAVMVAASTVYQGVIHFGLPYATVYLQGFGLAIAVAACVPLRIASPPARRMLWISFGIAVLVLFASNVVVARQFDDLKYARRTILEGISHGAVTGVPARAWVFLDHSYYWVNDNSYFGVDDAAERGPLLWDSRYFYRLWSGRAWRTRPLSAEKLGAGEDAYEIRSIANDARRGSLVIEQVRGRAGGPPVIVAATIFERGISADAPPAPAATSAFAAQDFTLVDRGPDWRVTAFHPHFPALPNDALVANAPSAARIVYRDGFSVVEEDGEMQFRWAGARATMTVVNETASSFVTELRAAIGTPQETKRVEIDSDPRPIDVNITLPPHGKAEIHFEAAAPNVALAGDGRDLRFRVIDAVLTDRTGPSVEDAR